MFTVNDEDEAKRLIALACPTTLEGDHYAPELVEEQTLEKLQAFSQRLHDLYHSYIMETS